MNEYVGHMTGINSNTSHICMPSDTTHVHAYCETIWLCWHKLWWFSI